MRSSLAIDIKTNSPCPLLTIVLIDILELSRILLPHVGGQIVERIELLTLDLICVEELYLNDKFILTRVFIVFRWYLSS